MAFRHMWRGIAQAHGGHLVDRCAHCNTERVRDITTKSLYLYRRGRAIPPNKEAMSDDWRGYVAGVVPKCAGPDLNTAGTEES